MTQQLQFSAIIPPEFANQRLDHALAQLYPEYSRAAWQKWLSDGMVFINDKNLRAKDKLKGGEILRVDVLFQEIPSLQAEALDIEIIYRDDDLFIVNKPRGLVVHPGAGNAEHTLVNALLYHDPNLALLPRAGLLHRLDKDTTGLLIVARHLTSYHALQKQLQDRTISREYIALVKGECLAGGTIDEPLARHPRQRTLRAVVASGKPAITHFRIRERLHRHTLLDVRLETGRTHQIRVHLAYRHYPILGDLPYGGKPIIPANAEPATKAYLANWQVQALHAHRLSLIHPTQQQLMTWLAPLPTDFVQLLEYIRKL